MDDYGDPRRLFPRREDFNDFVRVEHRRHARQGQLDNPEIQRAIDRVAQSPQEAEELRAAVRQLSGTFTITPADILPLCQSLREGRDPRDTLELRATQRDEARRPSCRSQARSAEGIAELI